MNFESELNVLVILAFGVLIGPRVSLQELLDSLFDRDAGVERPFDWLPREGVCATVLLHMLFYR
jgi:hypothetical protein